MAGKVIHFGAAVTAQQLPAIEAHGTEVLILDGGWGALLGSKSSGNESLLFRRCAVHLQWPLPSQRCDSDLSSPQPWALGGIRQAVLADLGEEGSLSRRSTVLTNAWQGWGGWGRATETEHSLGGLLTLGPQASQVPAQPPCQIPCSRGQDTSHRGSQKAIMDILHLVLAKRQRSNKNIPEQQRKTRYWTKQSQVVP